MEREWWWWVEGGIRGFWREKGGFKREWVLGEEKAVVGW